MSLEDAFETQTIVPQGHAGLSLSGHPSSQLQEQQPAALSIPPSPSSTNPGSGLSRFEFEDDLESSRVYRRAQRDSMDFSFRSSIARTNAWSIFSGLSLGDISAISVIALPVFAQDITNAHHYVFGKVTSTECRSRNSVYIKDIPMPRDIARPLQGRPLLVECNILKDKMLQIPGMETFFDQVESPPDSFHHLWEVLSQASPLVILVQALCPNIGVPLERWKDSSPDPKDNLSPETKEVTIRWFLRYCRIDLNLPVNNLFNISDLTEGDCYGFLKVRGNLIEAYGRNCTLTST